MTTTVFYHDDNDKLRVFETDKPTQKVKTKYEDLSSQNEASGLPLVKKSQIPNAGYGLWATKDYKTNQLITRYGGTQLSDTDVKRSASKYVITDDEGRHWDARLVHDLEHERGRWINDPGTKYSPNVEARTNKDGVSIYAKRPIKKGDEFFMSYGSRYWERPHW